MAHRRHDRGMTLVELLVTVTMVGLVVTVLSSAIVVFLRNQDDTTDRVDRTRGLQQLVNHFPADAASAQRIEITPPWTQPCLSLGTPVLNLVWSESFAGDALVTSSVTYLRTPDGARLVRNECAGGPVDAVTVARNVTDVRVALDAAAPGQIDLVLDFGGTEHVISGRSRNR